MSYTVEQLRNVGPPFATAMLLHAIEARHPFVTYAAIKEELEYQLGIERIFPPQIGQVAGSMMDQILEMDPRAPLINVLITRGNGIPGKGAGGYLAKRYNDPKFDRWKQLSHQEKVQTIAHERDLVFKYPHWKRIYHQLFDPSVLKKLRPVTFSEKDGKQARSGGYGGEVESKDHKILKDYVARHPAKIGLGREYKLVATEADLLPGDSVDVLFARGTDFVTVEVKSCRSNDPDLERGIYQCVKYREVKRAEFQPTSINVRSILVTERELPSDLKDRARLLDITSKVVRVNETR